MQTDKEFVVEFDETTALTCKGKGDWENEKSVANVCQDVNEIHFLRSSDCDLVSAPGTMQRKGDAHCLVQAIRKYVGLI